MSDSLSKLLDIGANSRRGQPLLPQMTKSIEDEVRDDLKKVRSNFGSIKEQDDDIFAILEKPTQQNKENVANSLSQAGPSRRGSARPLPQKPIGSKIEDGLGVNSPSSFAHVSDPIRPIEPFSTGAQNHFSNNWDSQKTANQWSKPAEVSRAQPPQNTKVVVDQSEDIKKILALLSQKTASESSAQVAFESQMQTLKKEVERCAEYEKKRIEQDNQLNAKILELKNLFDLLETERENLHKRKKELDERSVQMDQETQKKLERMHHEVEEERKAVISEVESAQKTKNEINYEQAALINSHKELERKKKEIEALTRAREIENTKSLLEIRQLAETNERLDTQLSEKMAQSAARDIESERKALMAAKHEKRANERIAIADQKESVLRLREDQLRDQEAALRDNVEKFHRERAEFEALRERTFHEDQKLKSAVMNSQLERSQLEFERSRLEQQKRELETLRKSVSYLREESLSGLISQNWSESFKTPTSIVPPSSQSYRTQSEDAPLKKDMFDYAGYVEYIRSKLSS